MPVTTVGIAARNWLSADETAGESACVGVGKALVGEAGGAPDCAAAAKGCAARLGNEYAAKDVACPMAVGSSANFALVSVGAAELAGKLPALQLATFEPAAPTSKALLEGGITLARFALNCTASGCRFEEASARFGAEANPHFAKTARSGAPASDAMGTEDVGTEGALPGAVAGLVTGLAASLPSGLMADFEFRFKEFSFAPELTLQVGAVLEPDLESTFVASFVSPGFAANSPNLESDFAAVLSMTD